MATLAQMISEIESDTERSDTDAIRKKILAAIRNYSPTRFFFNESRDVTFATVSGQTEYTFGTDITTEFYGIDGVWLTQGTNVYEVRRTTYTALEQLLDGAATQNQPTLYAWVNRKLRVYPEPNAAYSVRITGHIKAAAPASDAETDNVWMTEAYDLIMSRAKAELYAHRWEEPAAAQVMRVAEAEALDRLLATTDTKIGSGFVIPTQF